MTSLRLLPVARTSACSLRVLVDLRLEVAVAGVGLDDLHDVAPCDGSARRSACRAPVRIESRQHDLREAARRDLGRARRMSSEPSDIIAIASRPALVVSTQVQPMPSSNTRTRGLVALDHVGHEVLAVRLFQRLRARGLRHRQHEREDRLLARGSRPRSPRLSRASARRRLPGIGHAVVATRFAVPAISTPSLVTRPRGRRPSRSRRAADLGHRALASHLRDLVDRRRCRTCRGPRRRMFGSCLRHDLQEAVASECRSSRSIPVRLLREAPRASTPDCLAHHLCELGRGLDLRLREVRRTL